MLPLLYLLSLLSLTSSSSSSSSPPPPTLYTATIHHFPLPSSETPLPLASLSYNPAYPEKSTLLSFHPPRGAGAPTSSSSSSSANSTSSELTRVAVAIIDSSSSSSLERRRYRTTLTSLASFHPPYQQGRFRLVVTKNGQVLGGSWHAAATANAAAVTTTIGGSVAGDNSATAGNKGRGSNKGDFDLLVEKQGPRPVLEKFVVKGQPTVNEEGEEVVEKTLFQRYWWVLVGVAFLALSGGGGE